MTEPLSFPAQVLPTSHSGTSPPNSPSKKPRLPAWLLLALALQASWAGWLWWQGSLPSTSDSVCFKQPAYMRLHTPNFSIPSYTGRGPSVEIINSYPAVVYFYANYAAYKLFGFSHYTSIAVDLATHLAFSALGGWALWRLTGRQLPALLFVYGSGHWFLTSGRPEEMGMLLALAALVCLPRGKAGLGGAMVLLGLAGATSPGAAVVGTTLLLAYDGFSRHFNHEFLRRAGLLILFSVMISLAVYVGFAWPFVGEAWRQDRMLRGTGFYTTSPITELIRSFPAWAATTGMVTLGALFLAVYCAVRKPRWFPRESAAGAFVLAAGVAILAGLTLNILAQRLVYDYRHVMALGVAALGTACCWWTNPSGGYSRVSWALSIALALACTPVQRDLARHTLAPLASEPDPMSLEEAKRLVDELIPPDASVGGDGAVWALIDDGRPFILTRTVDREHWPEYVISGTWSRTPAAAQTGFTKQKLDTEYDEITPRPLRPQDGCAVNVMGVNVPIATGRCDWYVRVWKRKPGAMSQLP